MAAPTEQIFLFSGQGSQFYQMGRELFEGLPVFQTELETLDWVFQSLEGISLLEVIYGPKSPHDPFDNIRWSHPALFIVQHALAQALIKEGLRPDRLLGFSLGEYVARAVAGEFDVDVILHALNEQARILSARAPKGFMMAVLENIDVLAANPDIMQISEIAATGPEKITILAGRREELPRLKHLLSKQGVAVYTLPVGIPFHSKWIETAQNDWLDTVGPMMPKSRTHPIVGDDAHDITDQAPFLWSIVRKRADFAPKLRQINKHRPVRFIDLGPSSTMSNWVRHTSSDAVNWSACPIMQLPGRGDLARFQSLFQT